LKNQRNQFNTSSIYEFFMIAEGIEESKRFFTSSVALVTASFQGTVNVMSAEWSLRVSIEPYLVAVFVGFERGTLPLIERSGEFGLSYCSEDQALLAHVAGSRSINEGVEKWALAEFKKFRGKFIEAPLIGGCTLNLECRVINRFVTGDHVEFVGEVLNAFYDAEKKPLIYRGGKYFKIGDRVQKVQLG
jgi:flavin reductase (DIM6/NTAB) family NADH-FMN oxidoreductase RutF